MAKKLKLTDPKETRLALGENQSTFWGRIGYSQSAGSRIEQCERHTHKSVRILLALMHGKATIDQLRSGELAERV